MFKLKSVTQSLDTRTIVGAIRSQYSDTDHLFQVRITSSGVEIRPDLSDLEWHLNKDRESFLDDLRDFISEWS